MRVGKLRRDPGVRPSVAASYGRGQPGGMLQIVNAALANTPETVAQLIGQDRGWYLPCT